MAILYRYDLCFGMHLNHNNGTHPYPEECAFHSHETCEIFYLVSGSVCYFIENNIYNLTPGDMIIINSGEVHKIAFHPDRPYESFEIRFDPTVPAQFNSHVCDLLNCFANRPKGHRNKISLQISQIENVLGIFYKIENIYNSSFYGQEILRLTTFIDLLVYINRLYMNIEKAEKSLYIPEKILNVINYIDSNLDNNLSLEFLENKFFINRSYLSRTFKKYTGTSIHEYIILKRIIKSKELLSKGFNVTQACQLSGFNDYAHFVKMFKKIIHMSPSQFIKKEYDGSTENKSIGAYNKQNRYIPTHLLPDLIVTDVLWRPSNPAEGDEVLFSAVVKNTGNGPKPEGIILGVGFSVGPHSVTWSDIHVSRLNPGDSVTLTANTGKDGIPVWIAQAGTHIVTAYVDDVHRIYEENKENNRLCKTITVKRA